MEACCGAHHVGRLFAAQGHEVRLMSPEYVRPYVRAQKNDDNDAAGIAEAATRPTMRSEEHTSELQSLMRISYAVFCLKKKNTKKTHNTKDKKYIKNTVTIIHIHETANN